MENGESEKPSDMELVVYDDNKNDDSTLTPQHQHQNLHLHDSKSITQNDSHHNNLPKTKEIKSVLNDSEMSEYEETGTPLEQQAFMKELQTFYRERSLEFKPPKFYGVPLNCLKLWRAVIKLGGYDIVTGSKLWRLVGESFHPPKTCTTVSWTFRIFYEKALLEYEKYKRETGELQLPVGSFHQPSSVEKETTVYQTPGSGRARRDAAARAMQGWHAQRLQYGEVAEQVSKDKNFSPTTKREKNLKSIGVINKQRTPTGLEQAEKASNIDGDRQLVTAVVDIGPPADWVKINVRETKDCFEVYALVPGLLREEVRVQSDPVGRVVITGHPEQVDNPWGITPFKKVVNLPARVDPLQTTAVVSLHGRLFVRVPFEQGAI
ncbi:PREDICTED: AT-rich interactive domain-containing protein 5 [Lupinus angustifolius]|uniref:AT-rich interactive domain-containing protein 5 n=1 Tax=Lupinus angustifolius TaxID=3871 RepID=UPI00092F757C|nr:PREDICTED: AT-rich interactive domain-containing protein 5 [Lupinus angustifolius]XP_019438147.1 PREDICTED: AT-rich interactive domain-containing protein 5 [Lupinus angustifolius]